MSKIATRHILFVDIDDVLCLNKGYGGYDVIDAINGRHENPTTVFREVFDARAIEALERIHQSMDGALRYVVSSTWREVFDGAQMREVFRKGGLGFVAEALHEEWCTPCGHYPSLRASEIANWLDRHHRGEQFAIVDDTFSGLSLKPALNNAAHPFHGRVVLCQEQVGLLPEHVELLIQALRLPLGS